MSEPGEFGNELLNVYTRSGTEVLKVSVKAAIFAAKKLDEILKDILDKLNNTNAPTYHGKGKITPDRFPTANASDQLNLFINSCKKDGVNVTLAKDPINPENVNIFFRADRAGRIENTISDFLDKAKKPSIASKLVAAIKKSAELAANQLKKEQVKSHHRTL